MAGDLRFNSLNSFYLLRPGETFSFGATTVAKFKRGAEPLLRWA